MKEVERVAKFGEKIKMLIDYDKFHKGQELKCIEECSDNINRFTDGINSHYLLKERYVVLEKEEKKIEDPSLLINEEFDEPKEMVDHPSHYNQGKREVIEEMRILFGDDAVESFCRLNAYKYMRRAEFKGNKKEDLDKAEWYMDYIEKMRGER